MAEGGGCPGVSARPSAPTPPSSGSRGAPQLEGDAPFPQAESPQARCLLSYGHLNPGDSSNGSVSGRSPQDPGGRAWLTPESRLEKPGGAGPDSDSMTRRQKATMRTGCSPMKAERGHRPFSVRQVDLQKAARLILCPKVNPRRRWQMVHRMQRSTGAGHELSARGDFSRAQWESP